MGSPYSRHLERVEKWEKLPKNSPLRRIKPWEYAYRSVGYAGNPDTELYDRVLKDAKRALKNAKRSKHPKRALKKAIRDIPKHGPRL